MLTKSSDYIAVSLSEEALKIVQIKGSGLAAKVVNILNHDVKGVSSEEVGRIVQSALNGFNTKRANLIYVIPPTMTTTKNIEIPPVIVPW